MEGPVEGTDPPPGVFIVPPVVQIVLDMVDGQENAAAEVVRQDRGGFRRPGPQTVKGGEITLVVAADAGAAFEADFFFVHMDAEGTPFGKVLQEGSVFPHAGGRIHLQNLGTLLMGHQQGRAAPHAGTERGKALVSEHGHAFIEVALGGAKKGLRGGNQDEPVFAERLESIREDQAVDLLFGKDGERKEHAAVVERDGHRKGAVLPDDGHDVLGKDGREKAGRIGRHPAGGAGAVKGEHGDRIHRDGPQEGKIRRCHEVFFLGGRAVEPEYDQYDAREHHGQYGNQYDGPMPVHKPFRPFSVLRHGAKSIHLGQNMQI